jgi:regulator of sigma E protease
VTFGDIFAYLLTIGVLIVVHEFAHYRVAVACGVKVDRFSIGFGRVLWRYRRTPDSTEFVLSAIPLGGYVRWIDDREDPPLRSGEAVQTFASKRLWQRAAIVAAGPVSNLVLAALLFSVVHWHGVQEPRAVIGTPPQASLAAAAGLRAGDLVTAAGHQGPGVVEPDWIDVRAMSDLNWALTQSLLRRESLSLRVRGADDHGERVVTLRLDQLPPGDLDAEMAARIGVAAQGPNPMIREVIAGGPGAVAGLKVGDRVLAVDGQQLADVQALLERIRSDVANGQPRSQNWSIERGGHVLQLQIQPRATTENGRPVARVDVGLASKAMPLVTVRYGLFEGLLLGAKRTWQLSAITLKIMGQMLTGQASLNNLSGPLSIAQAAGESLHRGFTYYFSLLAALSVSLGVLNLLPIPVLDGGHLMYYIFEAVTGRPVAGQWLRRLQSGGFAILLLLMSLALYNDVARHLGPH